MDPAYPALLATSIPKWLLLSPHATFIFAWGPHIRNEFEFLNYTKMVTAPLDPNFAGNPVRSSIIFLMSIGSYENVFSE